jgi:uncharacterized repeat protein (TIGR03803 family)
LILFLLIATISTVSPAQTFATFLDFDQTNGANPHGTLIQGSDGNFYGTSQFGGTIGYGNVFRITPEGVATSVYSICGQPACMDGYEPIAGLVQGANGKLYGTTPGSVGTIFSIDSENTLTTLHRFCSRPDCADGGGNYCYTDCSCGTVFKLTLDLQ